MDKNKLKKKIEERLSVPGKAVEGDSNKTIERDLGIFLVNEGYIKGIEENSDDWGFVYRSFSKTIAISKKEMPHQKWEDCIFKMGINEKTKENLFPSPSKETEKYRFLHEASHAYQEYLTEKESPDNPAKWHEKALSGEIESFYASLFVFCFSKRLEELEKEKECDYCARGLSVWGNAPNYDYKTNEEICNIGSEIAIRAQEDANELVTMYIWHPDYFNAYINYLSLNYENKRIREGEFTEDDLKNSNLVKITKEEAEKIKEEVLLYVEEMKKNIQRSLNN